jgi:hypothetical protein
VTGIVGVVWQTVVTRRALGAGEDTMVSKLDTTSGSGLDTPGYRQWHGGKDIAIPSGGDDADDWYDKLDCRAGP